MAIICRHASDCRHAIDGQVLLAAAGSLYCANAGGAVNNPGKTQNNP